MKFDSSGPDPLFFVKSVLVSSESFQNKDYQENKNYQQYSKAG